MISGFISIIFFKFVVTEIESVGAYFKELDVLAPSFLVAIIVGWIFSKLYPPKADVIESSNENSSLE